MTGFAWISSTLDCSLQWLMFMNWIYSLQRSLFCLLTLRDAEKAKGHRLVLFLAAR